MSAEFQDTLDYDKPVVIVIDKKNEKELINEKQDIIKQTMNHFHILEWMPYEKETYGVFNTEIGRFKIMLRSRFKDFDVSRMRSISSLASKLKILEELEMHESIMESKYFFKVLYVQHINIVVVSKK